MQPLYGENRQRAMQEKSGAQARALQLDVQALLEDIIERKGDAPAGALFPQFAAWRNEQLLDNWDFVNLSTEIEDYGMADWKGRRLDTIAVKAIVRDRNRLLGVNRETCFMIGGIVDNEFDIYRHPIDPRCDVGPGRSQPGSREPVRINVARALSLHVLHPHRGYPSAARARAFSRCPPGTTANLSRRSRRA
jgi:hypothetical protein